MLERSSSGCRCRATEILAILFYLSKYLSFIVFFSFASLGLMTKGLRLPESFSDFFGVIDERPLHAAS